MNAPFVNTSLFVYRFQDASVPPEYHRSYTISVTHDNVHLLVDSYGNILLDKSFTLKESAYKSFVAALLVLNIKNCEALDLRPVPGSKSEELHFYTDEGNEIKGKIYNGGGNDYGSLAGNVGEAVMLFKALIPDLQKLVSGAGKKDIWG